MVMGDIRKTTTNYLRELLAITDSEPETYRHMRNRVRAYLADDTPRISFSERSHCLLVDVDVMGPLALPFPNKYGRIIADKIPQIIRDVCSLQASEGGFGKILDYSNCQNIVRPVYKWSMEDFRDYLQGRQGRPAFGRRKPMKKIPLKAFVRAYRRARPGVSHLQAIQRYFML